MDVYDSLPTLVTTFVAIMAKISIFIFMLDLVHFSSEAKTEFFWTDILQGDFRNYLLWDQLLNSWNALKLTIPNYNWEIISGWINSLCMVISIKIIEKEMGNQGFKSIISSKNVIVKKQRVYNSWQINNIFCLKYTLTSFERNCQIKFFSNQINKRRSYTSVAANSA